MHKDRKKITSKHLLADLKALVGKSEMELMCELQKNLQTLPEYGNDKFILSDITKHKSGRPSMLWLNRKGIFFTDIAAKNLSTAQHREFTDIQSYKNLPNDDEGFTLTYTNGQQQHLRTDDHVQIMTLLSRYIDLARASTATGNL